MERKNVGGAKLGLFPSVMRDHSHGILRMFLHNECKVHQNYSMNIPGNILICIMKKNNDNKYAKPECSISFSANIANKYVVICRYVVFDQITLEGITIAVLREEFSKFGKVTKIFIDADITYAKVYLDNVEDLELACSQLNGHTSWQVKSFKDNYKENKNSYKSDNKSELRSPDSANMSRSRSSLNQSYGGGSSNGMIMLDDDLEDCSFAGDYVDVHGRSVEVLQGENGVMYVNLDDIRTAGYNVYKKESFENATITKDIELRSFENYLLNQARKYCLETKKNFNEDEMLGVLERVKAKLQRKSAGEFGQGRIVNAGPNTKNFTITKSNVRSAPAAGSWAPRELPGNFQPTFSHVKPKPRGQQYRSNEHQDRPNHVIDQPNRIDRLQQGNNRLDDRNDQVNRFDGRENRRNATTSPAGSRHSYDDQDNTNDDKRKPVENNPSFTEVNQTPQNLRKPRQDVENVEVEKNLRSKALANANVIDKPVENFEDKSSSNSTKTTILRSQNDTSSVTNDRRNINIERRKLEPKGTYKIKVSHIKPDKRSLFYAQSLDDLNQIEEILLHVNTTDLELPEIVAPARDMLCVVQFEDCWYRAVVLNENPTGGCHVELIDYGNKEIIRTPLREMSPDMKKIPGMAMRVTAHNHLHSENIAMEQELEVFVRKHITDEYDDLTHLVEIKRIIDGPKLDQEPQSPPGEISSDQEAPRTAKPTNKQAAEISEDCFMEISPTTVQLTNGECVMIVSYTDSKFILRNKETAMKCKELYAHMDSLKKKSISNPKVGQLVLGSKDGSENMHRAVITKINNQVAEIEHLDHYGGESLALKSLRHIDALCAGYPITKVESPEVSWLRKVTEKSDSLLTDLVMNKTKLKVVLDGSKFDLLLSEGGKAVPLSRKIEELENPPKEVPKEPVVAPVPSKSEKVPVAPKKEPPVTEVSTQDKQFIEISFNDMPFAEAKIGEGEFICYNYNELSVTLLSTNDAGQYLESLVVDEPADTVPHVPDVMHMCLGKFEDIWYRAVVLEVEDELCNVLFVDFGNTESIPKKDVRKFPKKFAKIPILGMNAYLIGIPDKPETHERLKKLIPDEEEFKVIVKTELDENLKYGIEIPSVYAQLKKENLM